MRAGGTTLLGRWRVIELWGQEEDEAFPTKGKKQGGGVSVGGEYWTLVKATRRGREGVGVGETQGASHVF